LQQPQFELHLRRLFLVETSFGDRSFPFLGIAAPLLAGQTADARVNTITLGHLIDHQGGWNRDTAQPSLHPSLPLGFDPCSGPMLRLIARDLGLTHVASKMDVARYMFGEPLQFTPGTSPNFVYSNLGYLLLGLAVEKKSGRSFIDFLRSSVLAPIGVSDVLVAATQSTASPEVRYHSVDAARSVFVPHLDTVWVSTPYGSLSTETTDSSGGLLASAPSVVRTIAHHAAWGMGPRAPGTARIGSMPGTFSCASSRGNGYDYAVLFNGDDGFTDTIRDKFVSDVNSVIDAVP